MNTAPKLHEAIETLRKYRNNGSVRIWDMDAALDVVLSAIAPPSGEGVDAPPAWQNLGNAEAEFLRNLADNGGLAPLVAGMLRHCARLLDRTTKQTAPVDGMAIGYVMQSLRDGSVFETFIPSGRFDFDKRMQALKADPWIVNGAAHIIPLYTTPQPAPVDSAFERAMKASWEMVVTTPAWAAGSFIAGQNSGMVKALETVRENYEREIARQQPATPPPASQERGGVALIAAERERQQMHPTQGGEGWTQQHDDYEWDEEQLACAAAAYALPARVSSGRWSNDGRPFFWPWDARWWKPVPSDRVRELVKAGALIAAEIDRLQRASPPSSAAEPDSFGVASPFDHTKPPVVRPDSYGVAGAAEQAKPGMAVDDAFAAHIANLDQDELEAEQAQAGERITTLPLWDELELEAAIHPNQYKANCLREAAALLRRLAGGVTDDAVVRALCAYYHDGYCTESIESYMADHNKRVRDDMRAALVAALGAK